MPSRNQSHPEIPVSTENNLYFIDRSLVKFAHSYEPSSQVSMSPNQSDSAPQVFTTSDSDTPSGG